MLFRLILIFFQIDLSISTISLIKYNNSQFSPSQNSYLLNNFSVQSQYECICQCYTNQSCITLTYFGINQTCLLYSSPMQMGYLQLTTYAMNSAVISFPNRIPATTQMTSTSSSSTSSTSTSSSSTSTSTSSTSTSTTTTNVYCGYSCVNTTVSTLSSVAFYTFDNNTFDSIGNYSMNETFAPSYVSGWIGSAVRFTYSSSQFLSTRTHIPLDSRSFTVDLWFYATDLTTVADFGFGGEREAASSYRCLFLHIRNKALRMVFFSADTSGATSLTTNQWYHATFVYDSAVKQQLIYLNGFLDKNSTVLSDFLGTTGLFTIGGAYVGGDSPSTVYYSGYIDHFRISYRVKTPCEIYLNAILYCYFRFDDSLISLTDSGPNLIKATNYNGIQAAGRVNNGLQFSSSSSYVTINGVNILNSFNNPFTISMWIKPFNLTAGGTLIHTSTQSNGAGTCFALWGFSANASFIMNFIDSTNNTVPITISTPLPLNQWTHIVQIFNSANGNFLYMNGNLMSNVSLPTRASIGSYVFLGSSPTNTSACKSGLISMGQFLV